MARMAVGVVNRFPTPWSAIRRRRLARVEPALAPVDQRLHPEPPGPEDAGHDPGDPGPLAGRVEQLARPDVMAELELLVPKEIAVGVQDPLGQPRRSRGVVELGRGVGVGGRGLEPVGGRPGQVLEALGAAAPDHHQALDRGRLVEQGGHPVAVGGRGDQHLGLGVVEPVDDRVVAVQHRHRQQDRLELVGGQEAGRDLGEAGAITATRSPLPTPSSRRVLAVRSVSRRTSPNVQRSSRPSSDTKCMAGRSGSCLSSTSAARL